MIAIRHRARLSVTLGLLMATSSGLNRDRAIDELRPLKTESKLGEGL
jgi:hypothetical protein